MNHPVLVLLIASIGTLGPASLAAPSSSADAPRAFSYDVDDSAERLAAPVADEGFLRVPKAGANLLVNGSFEQNDGETTFTGWSEFNDRIDPLSDGGEGTIDAVSDWWVQEGTVSPLGFFQEIPPPSDGRFAALTEQNGPGLHILYQDVTIPPQGASLSCDLWLFSASEPSWIVPSPPSFDFRELANQQARVDIVSTSTVTGLGGGVLRNLFQTRSSDPAFIAPFTLHTDLSDFAGQRIRLRFAEADTQNFLLFAVDNCSIVAAEEPVDEDEPIFGEEIQIVPGSVEPMVPTVQYNPDGTKAVIWMQNGGDGTIICIQIIDENDQAVTTPLIVNSGGVINETPTVDVRPDGTYQIVWTRRDGSAVRNGEGRLVAAAGGGSSIVSRGFTPEGTNAGSETVISNAGADDSNAPSAASDENGNTAVAWEDGGQVKGRVLGNNGSPQTGIFGISTALGTGATKPVLATSASGDLVACWRQSTGTQAGILCRRLSITGAAASDFIRVDPTPNSRAPDVAMDEFGNFIVVWEENGVDGRDIFGRRYERNGTPEGPAVILNAETAGDQTRPRVSRTAAGAFVTVWESNTIPAGATRAPSAVAVGGGTSIVSRGFSPEGEAETDDVVVAESDATSDPDTPDVNVDDKGKTTVTFERKKTNGDSDGIFRREVLLPKAPSVCTEDSETLCLNGDRFRIRAEWKDSEGDRGPAKAEQLTDDTGYFYFFNPENVEVVIKGLDACSFADAFWVFAGGLTDVEVTLVVEDTASGQGISYFNPIGAFQPIRDTAAFATCDQGAVREDPQEISQMSLALRAEIEALAAADLDELARTREQAGAGSCFSTATRLCLNGGRFAVEVDFDTGTDSGPALRNTLTDETGYFTFFDPSNVEVVVKLLNACGINNRYWVFAAGLTDVEVTLTVTDTSSGGQNTYFNQGGNAFRPITDTDAFATCP